MKTQRALQTFADNPFVLLGATSRDDRRRIVELADSRLLDLAPDVCQKARAALTNPRSRLAAEIGWLPGVSPTTCSQVLEGLAQYPQAMRRNARLPALPQANVTVACIATAAGAEDARELAEMILELAGLMDTLDHGALCRHINEDRAVAGFPEVRDMQLIEHELAERYRYFRRQTKSALNRLPTTALIHTMTEVVDEATSGGKRHAPKFIDDLVHMYEVDAGDFLDRESANVYQLIDVIPSAVEAGTLIGDMALSELARVTRNWDRVAQPVQVSFESRGQNHEASQAIAWRIRSLSIELFNSHANVAAAKRLLVLLEDVFAELPELAERVAEDKAAIERITRGDS